jgi:hypothetical protein
MQRSESADDFGCSSSILMLVFKLKSKDEAVSRFEYLIATKWRKKFATHEQNFNSISAMIALIDEIH